MSVQVTKAVLPNGKTVKFDNWVYTPGLVFTVKQRGTGFRAGQILLGQGYWQATGKPEGGDINSWVYEDQVRHV